MSSGSSVVWDEAEGCYIPNKCFHDDIVGILSKKVVGESGDGVTTPQYTPYKSQVGGEHYQKAIQPMLFISSNNFNFSVGNVIKYVCRHEQKNGKQDLIKAIHYAMFEAYHKYPDEYDEFIKQVNNLNGKEAPEEE